MAWFDFLFGKPDKISQISTKSPGQNQAMEQLLQQISQMQSQGGNYAQAQNHFANLLSGDPTSYDRWAAPYMQQFEQETVPRLAERFAGLGGGLGGGALGSTGFAQALGGAGAQLQAQLANLFESLKQNAAQTSYGQYNNLLSRGLGTNTFENVYQPGNTGLVGGAATGLAQGLGSGLGMGAGYGLTGRLLKGFLGG